MTQPGDQVILVSRMEHDDDDGPSFTGIAFGLLAVALIGIAAWMRLVRNRRPKR
jgi:hypothetical protein